MNLCGRREFESKGQGEGQKGDRVFPTNGVSLTLPALTEAKVWALKRVAARLAPRTVPKSPGGWEAPRRSLRCPVRGRGEAGLRLLRLVKQPPFLPGPLPRRRGGGSEGARARPCSPARPGLPPAPPGTNEDTNMFCTGTAHMQTLMPSPPWRSERLMKPRGHVTGQHGQPRLCVYSAAHWATRAGRINTGNRARSNPNLPPGHNAGIGLTGVATPNSLWLFPKSHLKFKGKLHTAVWIWRSPFSTRPWTGGHCP